MIAGKDFPLRMWEWWQKVPGGENERKRVTGTGSKRDSGDRDSGGKLGLAVKRIWWQK